MWFIFIIFLFSDFLSLNLLKCIDSKEEIGSFVFSDILLTFRFCTSEIFTLYPFRRRKNKIFKKIFDGQKIKNKSY